MDSKLNQYEFLIPEDDPFTWRRIEARSFQDAAENACAYEDFRSAEYMIAKRGYLDEIQVRDATGNVKRFSIRVDCNPIYFAKETEDE